jgi:hypothetical protein
MREPDGVESMVLVDDVSMEDPASNSGKCIYTAASAGWDVNCFILTPAELSGHYSSSE